MNSSLFTLNFKDIGKSLVTAFFSGVIVSIAGVASTTGFDVLAAPWTNIFHTALAAGVATMLAYLAKNYFSTSDGKFMGMIG